MKGPLTKDWLPFKIKTEILQGEGEDPKDQTYASENQYAVERGVLTEISA